MPSSAKTLPVVILTFLTTLAPGFAADSAVAVPAPGAATNLAAPKIQFAEPIFDFGRVPEGEVIQHEFVFTNTGNATLQITEVRPSCNCTVAGEWSREVAPGATGIIPIQFSTARIVGPVMKLATVVCTDPAQPAVSLQLKGTVWRPIEVNPASLVLYVTADSMSNVTSVVRIVSNLQEPVTLTHPESNNRAFVADLKTIQEGKEFQLTVTAVPPLTSGTVQGTITLKSSWTNMPVMSIPVFAVVQPALVVVPSQILLPATRPPAYAVSIRNNSGSPVTLSEPSVNVSGIDLKLKEIEPGRQFTVTLTFRPEFSLAAGQQAELTLKTSHPRYPTLKVPVRQYLRASPAGTAVRPLSQGTNIHTNPVAH